MSRVARYLLIIALGVAPAACKEGGTITVHSLDFKGVNSIDVNRLKSALATRENTKVPVVGWQLPWGKKSYFDRGRFDADLKRIEAFYADRGFPDARITDFDVKLNDKQDSVDVAVTIDEGQPVKVVAVQFRGFDDVPQDHFNQMKAQGPLGVGKPRDPPNVTAGPPPSRKQTRGPRGPQPRAAA